MKNYRKHIDDFFREKLGNYTETPPADVWDDLSQRLEGLQPPPGTPTRWLLHVTLGSLLLVLGVSMLRKTPFNAFRPTAVVSESAIGQGTATASNPPAPSKENGVSSKPASDGAKSAALDEGAANNNAQAKKENTPAARNGNNNARTFVRNKPSAKPSVKNKNTVARYASSGGGNVNANGNTGKGPNQTEPNDIEAGQSAQEANPKTAALAAKTTVQTPPALNSKTPTTLAAKKAANANNRTNDFNRFEAGVKIGYEKGTDGGSASKYVVSPYLQYNLNKKFSLIVQPAVKSATINNMNVGSTQGNYEASGNGQTQFVSDVATPQSSGGNTLWAHTTTYNYSQSFVSTIKSYTYGGTYTEFELPLLLKYKLVKSLSVYGGVSIDYSRLVGLTAHMSKNSITISKNQASTDTNSSGHTVAPPLPISSVINPPTSETQSQAFTSPQGTMIRCGYMIGFNYEYRKKWLFDALIQQSPTKADNQGSYNLNTPYSATYFRFTIGYKILQ